MAKKKKGAAKSAPVTRSAPPATPSTTAASASASTGATPPTTPATPLVAVGAPHSKQVIITFTFTSGIGQVTAVLFRKGVLINMQSISSSGTITFSEVQAGDVISVNGVCAGITTVEVDTPTVPVTPKTFPAGLIMANFLIK